jgi:hypothetical protein
MYLVDRCDMFALPRQHHFLRMLDNATRGRSQRHDGLSPGQFEGMKTQRSELALAEREKVAVSRSLIALRKICETAIFSIPRHLTSLDLKVEPFSPDRGIRIPRAFRAEFDIKLAALPDVNRELLFHAMAQQITFTRYRGYVLHTTVFDSLLGDFFRTPIKSTRDRASLLKNLGLFDDAGSQLTEAFASDTNPLAKLEALSRAFREIETVYRVHVGGELTDLLKIVIAYVNPPFVASVAGFIADFILGNTGLLLSDDLANAALQLCQIVGTAFRESGVDVGVWVLSRRAQEPMGILALDAENEAKEDFFLEIATGLKKEQRPGLTIDVGGKKVFGGNLIFEAVDRAAALFAPAVLEVRRASQMNSEEKEKTVAVVVCRDVNDKRTEADVNKFFGRFPKAQQRILMGNYVVPGKKELETDPRFSHLPVQRDEVRTLKTILSVLVRKVLGE